MNSPLVARLLFRPSRGSALLLTLIFGIILAVVTFGLVSLNVFSYQAEYSNVAKAKAYLAAENALREVAQIIADAENIDVEDCIGEYNWGEADSIYSTDSGLEKKTLTFFYTPDPDVQAMRVTVEHAPETDSAGNPTTYRDNHYLVQSQATVGGKTRALQMVLEHRPPARVFDYVYFLNDLGWWWNVGDLGRADLRSNWEFNFVGTNGVRGNLEVSGPVTFGKTGAIGIGTDGVNVPDYWFRPTEFGTSTDKAQRWVMQQTEVYVHTNLDPIEVPNLRDLTYYEQKALSAYEGLGPGDPPTANYIKYWDYDENRYKYIRGVQGDDETCPGIYLKGDSTHPIEISGTVVIRGDLVIEGVMKGMGTVYIGGNNYIARGLTYKNPPAYLNPANYDNSSPAQREAAIEAWVRSYTMSGGAPIPHDQQKDMVVFASQGHMLYGNINVRSTTSGFWGDPNVGLKLRGKETNLGADGIRATGDESVLNVALIPAPGTTYTNGQPDYYIRNPDPDAPPTHAARDMDGDGRYRNSLYDFAKDIEMNNTRIAGIENYPTVTSGGVTSPKPYGNSSSTSTVTGTKSCALVGSSISGIFFSRHTVSGGSGWSTLNGSIICRDEGIWSGPVMNYDWRIHSNFRSYMYPRDSDYEGEYVVDIELPRPKKAEVLSVAEIRPNWWEN